MSDKPNFVLIPDDAPPPSPVRTGGMLARLLTRAAAVATSTVSALQVTASQGAPPVETGSPPRPRLVFAIDATASREPAWAMARQVTDALVKAVPGELDVALAVHGGSRVHTFTAFTNDAATLRDRTAGVECRAGLTRMLPILSACAKQPALRVVIYIGDVFEENLSHGRRIADELGTRGTKLIVMHDTSSPGARQDAELFWDLARRTGGCVLPFDASSTSKLREILSAVAVYAVGGEKLLRERRHNLPGAVALLDHLGERR